MIGLVQTIVVSESSDGLSGLINSLELPVSSEQTEPNIPDLSAYPFLEAAGLSGPALLISANRIGGYVSLEFALFSTLIDKIKRLTSGEGDRLLAKSRLMADLGERPTAEHLEALPEGLRAPRGGRRGDLLWHTGIGWERLQGEGGAVMMTTPQGEPVWLPVADFVERLELASPPSSPSAEDAPEAPSFKRRSDGVETASSSDILSRLPVVWYSLGGSEQDERLRPAMLMPGTDERGDQRLIVFLSPDDRDWIAMNDGHPNIQRTGAEGRTPGTWRRI